MIGNVLWHISRTWVEFRPVYIMHLKKTSSRETLMWTMELVEGPFKKKTP
jgi:hypothetical protein